MKVGDTMSNSLGKVFVTGLIGLPVIANGGQIGFCRDIAINTKNKKLAIIVLTHTNNVIEIDFDKVELGSGILLVR